MTTHEAATKAACFFSALDGKDELQNMVIDLISTDALVLIATSQVGENGEDSGLIDLAIDTLCDRVGPDMARQLCGVE